MKFALVLSTLATATAQNIPLGFSSKLEADKDSMVFRTITVTQDDIDLSTSSNPRLFVTGSRSLTAGYKVYVKKDGNPSASDTLLVDVAKGSATGYAEGEFALTGAGSYKVGMTSECPGGICTGASTTLSAYLKVGSLPASGGNSTAGNLPAGSLAPFRITKETNGYTAYYRNLASVGQVGSPAAVITLPEQEELHFGGDVHSPTGGFTVLARQGAIPTTQANDDEIPSATGVGKEWTDKEKFEAGTWYFVPKVTAQSGTDVELSFAIGIGAPPVSASSSLAPGLAFVGATLLAWAAL
jgi:hypothetical protein